MTDVVWVCSASTVMTANGSGSLNTSRLKRPSAATTTDCFSSSARACWIWWRHSTCYPNLFRAEISISMQLSGLKLLYLQVSIACRHVASETSGPKLLSCVSPFRASHRFAMNSQGSPVCPDCGSSSINFDFDAGQSVCTSCGTTGLTSSLVLDSFTGYRENVFRTPRIPHAFSDGVYRGAQSMVKGAEWHLQNHRVSKPLTLRLYLTLFIRKNIGH
jgi:hypothetical protein